MKKSPTRYAIILHGPFVLQPGYRRVSGVVYVYLNLNRATLLQPIFLGLSDWCERRYSTEQYELTFFRASHEIKEGEKKQYQFGPIANAHHQSENVLRISEPKSYYKKVLQEDRRVHDLYSAIPIQKLGPRTNCFHNRIVFTWNSDCWRVSPTSMLLDIMCTTLYLFIPLLFFFPTASRC